MVQQEDVNNTTTEGAEGGGEQFPLIIGIGAAIAGIIAFLTLRKFR